ncbi:MAG: hypothetical protein BroJett011_17850 [Chloroflexota bacterium]|nr:MAG: hypothetical protein BroJett011_17850 [Chloroflexota bacterium]
MKTPVKKRRSVIILSSVLGLTLIATQAKSIRPDSDISAHYPKTVITANYTCGISINPAVPTITDTIQVRAGGEWPDTCVPQFSSYQMTNSEIRLDFTRPITIGACASMVSSWGHTIEVGVLPSGVYTAAARINNVTCASKTFVVFTETRKLYLPLITK